MKKKYAKEQLQEAITKVSNVMNNNKVVCFQKPRENIKFWKSYDGHKLPEKQVKRAYYNGTRTQNIIKMYINTPELIKFVREHANDYKTLNRKDVPSCITIDHRRSERYFSVYIEKFGNVRFDEVLRVFPLLPKSYLNE